MNRDIITIGLSEELNQYLDTAFEQEQRPVFACGGLTEARRYMGNESFGLIVYNMPLSPRQEAQEAVGSLRRLTYAPMLVLAPDEAVERVLDAGADCCLPTDTRRERAVAYARALIRRYDLYNRYNYSEPEASVLYRGDLVIDPLRHRVTLSGEDIYLQRREFRLLLAFARNPGIVLTEDQICETVWGMESGYSRNVSPVITQLRKKLNDDSRNPTYIETVYGVGYRFLPNK